MSLNWRLSRRDDQQSRLEGLDGRGHNDSSWQLVPNPNSSREETVVEAWRHRHSTHPAGIRNLHQCPLVFWVFGVRYSDTGIAISPLTILYIITALAWFLRTSNVFQPSCCIIRVGLPLLLDERPEWLCGLLQSFITDRAARLWTASIWLMLLAVCDKFCYLIPVRRSS